MDHTLVPGTNPSSAILVKKCFVIYFDSSVYIDTFIDQTNAQVVDNVNFSSIIKILQ